jgi:carnitine O-acetyltransferase
LDGTPTLRMNEFVLGALEKGKIDLDCSSGRNTSPLKAEELVFETDSTVEGHVKAAIDNFSKITSEHELIVCSVLPSTPDLELTSLTDRAIQRMR